jgi:hypothetical protein
LSREGVGEKKREEKGDRRQERRAERDEGRVDQSVCVVRHAAEDIAIGALEDTEGSTKVKAEGGAGGCGRQH